MRLNPRAFLPLVAGGMLLIPAPLATVALAESAPPLSQGPLISPRVRSGAPDLSEIRPTPEETQFLELANRERARRNLSELVFDPLLTYVARLHSAEMRDKKYFNHNSPTAGIRTPMDRYLKAVTQRPPYACVGENLFYCSVADVERGHQAFMNSPTHRENVLFPRFERMGVGIVKNERGEFWVTQMFLATTDPGAIARRVSASQ